MLLINEFFKMTGSNEPLDLVLQGYISVRGMTYVLMKSTITLYIFSSSLALHRFRGPIQASVSHCVDVI